MQNVQNGVVLGSYRSLKVTENSIIHQSAIRNYTTPLIFFMEKNATAFLKGLCQYSYKCSSIFFYNE